MTALRARGVDSEQASERGRGEAGAGSWARVAAAEPGQPFTIFPTAPPRQSALSDPTKKASQQRLFPRIQHPIKRGRPHVQPKVIEVAGDRYASCAGAGRLGRACV
eukprot:364934-Chlamydomonas_euryale.AAC.5